jgi:flavocytochrome c
MGRSPSKVNTLSAAALLVTACSSGTPPTDADVIVVGAGIAGISAALEASANGARVLVIEASSVAGGHAVKAGGFAMVGTPLQERKGHEDTPEIAFNDLMAWGEDANPEWVRYFAENSRTQIYDWLAAMGVKFTILLDTPEDTVPRFHFAGGTAVKVIVPMLRAAVGNDNIRFLLNTRAEELLASTGALTDVRVRHTRTGEEQVIRAATIILTTGGFPSNLDMVRANWPREADMPIAEPERLLIGSGQFATGGGIDLGRNLGAQLYRMDHQVIFINGLPDPRDPARGLKTDNPQAIWVNRDGKRFVNEAADSKHTEVAGLALSPQAHWMIFDAKGLKQLRIGGAAWLTPESTAAEILDNPAIGHKSETIAELAKTTGLPADNLAATVARYNQAVQTGADPDFQRFAGSGRNATTLSDSPYYALQLFPMTRKSMGGLGIDLQARVLDTDGRPIAGLYAAGELTGVAGINGSHGGSGTFLAPSVLTGRVAGRNAAAAVRLLADKPRTKWRNITESVIAAAGNQNSINAVPLNPLLALKRTGYWHFERSHGLIAERRYTCDRCHSVTWPPGPASTGQQKLLQLDSCSNCH